MVGNNGFTVNWNDNAVTAIDTLEEIHYHLKKIPSGSNWLHFQLGRQPGERSGELNTA
jgi:hypothetical protein